jgi:hypothetical protein
MSLEAEDLKGELNFYGKSKLIFSKEKYFNFHVPLALSRLLGLQDGDLVQVFVNMPRKVIILKLTKEEKQAKKK